MLNRYLFFSSYLGFEQAGCHRKLIRLEPLRVNTCPSHTIQIRLKSWTNTRLTRY